MGIKIKFNNNIPEQWKNNKYLKGVTLVFGVILTLSAVVSMVVKNFCVQESGLYQIFSGSNSLLNFILGGILLYLYFCLKR